MRRVWTLCLLPAGLARFASSSSSTCHLPVIAVRYPTCPYLDGCLGSGLLLSSDPLESASHSNEWGDHSPSANPSEPTLATQTPADPLSSSSDIGGSTHPTAASMTAQSSAIYTSFLSFSEWRERQESVLATLHHSLRSFSVPAPKPEPTQPAPSEAVAPLAADGQTDKAVDIPVRYVQPLPFSGTGQPEDPLLPLAARTNFASIDCSAAILRASKLSKGASAILTNAKDRYMLTPCSAKEKFVVVELCEEIDVDTVVLANYEFFSSMFKHVRVQGSEVYPGVEADWVTLGVLRAGNVRGPQVFKPQSAGRFFKYLRLDFLSHYGNEHYCPVSIVRVYGRNQMDAFRDEEAARISQQLDLERDQQPTEEVVYVRVQTHTGSPTAEAPTTLVAPTAPSTVPSPSNPQPLTTTTTTQDAATSSSVPWTTTDHVLSPSSVTLASSDTPASSLPPSDSTPAVSSSTPSSTNTTLIDQVISSNSSLAASTTSSTVTVTGPRPSTNNTSMSASANRPPIHQPLTSGESIYGAITKRLNSLEREVALTLRYVEEQGHLIQDIFLRLEARLSELDRVRTKNESRLKRLSLEFDLYRARVEEERIAMATQVNLLASEIVWGKRIAVAQLVALLAVLALVAVTRGSVATIVNFPLSTARKTSLFRSSTGPTALNTDLPDYKRPVSPSTSQRKRDKDRLPRAMATNLPKTTSLKRRPHRHTPNTERERASFPPLHKIGRSQTPPPRPRPPLSPHTPNARLDDGLLPPPRFPADVVPSPESAGWMSTSETEQSENESPTKQGPAY